jgi:hypothetical protein
VTGDESVAQLIESARAEPGQSRVERFRDRIADHGQEAVGPLSELRTDGRLAFFAMVVLERLAMNGVADATSALWDFASSGVDDEVKLRARDAIRRVDPPAVASPALMPIDPPVVLRPPMPYRPTRRGGIDELRRRRGEPAFDEAEMAQALAYLSRRAEDEGRYVRHCWNCKSGVDVGDNLRCPECRWLICWCGACRDPHKTSVDTGFSGPCVREAWVLWESIQQDIDFHGAPILSPAPPSPEAQQIRATLAQSGVELVYHWTPIRGIASVLSHGILCQSLLSRQQIGHVPHNPGNASKRLLLKESVAVSFKAKPWMMGAWSQSPVVIAIDAEILVANGTMFVDGNSAATSVALGRIKSGIGMEGLTRIFDARGGIKPQSEAWVPNRIPAPTIRSIHVQEDSMASRVRAAIEAYLPAAGSLSVIVSPEMFLTPSEMRLLSLA